MLFIYILGSTVLFYYYLYTNIVFINILISI